MGRQDLYLPTMPLNEDEVLVFDPAAYHFMHHLNLDWPFLSFDILSPFLGEETAVSIVGGTQAPSASENRLQFLRIAAFEQSNKLAIPDVQEISVPVSSTINRLRATRGESFLVASWHEDGDIQVHRISGLFRHACHIEAPSIIGSHSQEGFGLGWSLDGHRLASGDLSGILCLTDILAGPSTVRRLCCEAPLEDIVWSPSEASVLAVCSGDGVLRIWDSRTPEPLLTREVHATSANALAWHPTRMHVIATGSETGEFALWDLRNLQEMPQQHHWHSGPITSLAWCPSEEAVLAVSGEDNQTTIWDFSIVQSEEVPSGIAVPVPLMFVHQGQKDVKELHWASTHAGVLLTTANDGIDIFKTINFN